MNEIKINAYAKINLSLDVLSRLANGYHEVRMVMQTVSLHDELVLKKTNKKEIVLKTNLPYLPTNDNNLVTLAIRRFCERYRIDGGVSATLSKRIPVAAGLAGGSSDAAAALRAMNVLFDIHASLSELQEIGVTLGADVPYCLLGGTALAEGIGEKLTVLKNAPACACLIVKPDFSLSTKSIYEGLSLTDKTKHPNINAMLKAIETNNYKKMTEACENLLESVSISLRPEIALVKEEILRHGADCALMSGSGPSVFGLFHDRKKAESAFRQLKLGIYGKQCFLAFFR